MTTYLSTRDIHNLTTGALFLACAIDHEACLEYTRRVQNEVQFGSTNPQLISPSDLDADALVVSVGFVNSGLPLTEVRPVGDEFCRSIELLEQTVGSKVEGIFPLAAANLNAIVPFMTSLQTGIPVVDADPMGRVFPLLHHTVLALDGLPIGPVTVTGVTGESAVITVDDPQRAERLVRSLAGEFGGWAATVSYPISAGQLLQHGVQQSVTRMIDIGAIINAPLQPAQKYRELTRVAGVRRVIHARVIEVESFSRPTSPDQPDRPSSVTFIDEVRGRIVRLEIQNELLMLMFDGEVEAVVPDIITLLRPGDSSVASLEDLWIGNRLDILILPAHERWYTAEGIDLVGPKAFHVVMNRKVRGLR